jgi:tRNA threonylcarbamoyladenosine biosynthesis protein TsaB
VIDGESTLAESTRPIDGGSHATTLLPMIDEALGAAGLGLSELDLLAVSIGPGSFTGLRIGLSVAKGLSLATGLPLVGVPTLEAFARGAGKRSGLVCPVLDARKKEVYGAAFRWNGGALERVRQEAVLSPQRFAEGLPVPCTLIGDGVDAYESFWRASFAHRAELVKFRDCSPRGTSVASLGARLFASRGGDDPARLVPIYLRKSEAELQRETRLRHGHSPAVEKLTGSGR